MLKRYGWAVLVLVCAWEGASRLLGDALLPPPFTVWRFFLEALSGGAFWKHAFLSLWRVSAALILAFGAAFPLGLWLGHDRRADAVLSPIILLTYPVPKIVLLPVFLTLFGLGDASRLALIALTAGYQILVVTRDGARNLDQRYLDAFRSLRGGRLQLARHVLIPAALPEALTALRVAAGTAVAVLFMVESFATNAGLGYVIMDAWGRGDLPEMYAGIVAMSLMGVGLYELCNVAERLLCPWKSPA